MIDPPVQAQSEPPVVDADRPYRPGEILSRGAQVILSHREQAREAAQEVIDYGKAHKDDIRRAAYDAKEKIKEKLAELHYKKRSNSNLHDKLKGAMNSVRSGLLSQLARR